MNIDPNETEEQKVIREAKEKEEKDKLPIFTDEAFEEELRKRMGGGSADFIKKSEVPPVLTEAEKKKLEEDKEANVLSIGLAENWFTRKTYDEFQQLKATGKIEIARKQFIENNPELGKDAGSKFDELFLINEKDEVEVDEVMTPNTKKKLALGVAERLADEYVEKNYSSIINAASKFDDRTAKLKIEAANKVVIEKQVAAVPAELEIELVGIEEMEIEGLENKVKFKVSPEDVEEARQLFIKNISLLNNKNITDEKITENAITYIKAKNLGKIISEAVKTAVSKASDAYERGQKGLGERSTGAGGGNSAVEWMRTKGLQV